MTETWKDVVEYEGYYQISNMGNLKAVTRRIDHGQKNRIRTIKEKKRKLLKNKLGYCTIVLFKNGKGKNFKVHRLVAEAFISNPCGYPEVNHKDCNHSNNQVSNLEWVTHHENMLHASKNGKLIVPESAKAKLGLKTKELYSVPVVGTSIKTGEKIFFNSMSEAKRHGFRSGCVSLCYSNKRRSHKGYEWKTMTPDELARIKSE